MAESLLSGIRFYQPFYVLLNGGKIPYLIGSLDISMDIIMFPRGQGSRLKCAIGIWTEPVSDLTIYKSLRLVYKGPALESLMK